jgi:hypothetical protein
MKRQIWFALALVCGCRPFVVACQDDARCRRNGVAGSCRSAPSGRYCVFPDGQCASGERWDPTAGGGLGGLCVAGDIDGSADDGATAPDGGGEDGPTAPPDASADGAIGPSWHTEYSGPSNFDSVWGSSSGDIYVAGSGGIAHSTGRGDWQFELQIPQLGFDAVWGSAADDVYAVGLTIGGPESPIYHSTGKGDWTPQHSHTTAQLNGIWGSSRSDIYIVGENGTLLRGPGDGTWRALSIGTTNWLMTVWGADAAHVYIGAISVGTSDLKTILFSSGNDSFASQYSPASGNWISRLWGSGPDHLYAVAGGSHWYVLDSSGDGHWSTLQEGQKGNSLSAIGGSSARDMYIVGENGTVWHSSDEGQSWLPQITGSIGTLRAVWAASASDVYIVGDQTIEHWY